MTSGELKLTLSKATGRVVSMHHGSTHADMDLHLVQYAQGRHPSQPPWVVRPSGHYVFHPKGEQEVRSL